MSARITPPHPDPGVPLDALTHVGMLRTMTQVPTSETDMLLELERATRDLSASEVAAVAAFADGWREGRGQDLDRDDFEENVRIGRQAGEQAAVAAKWRRRVGATLETQDVTELLGLSRQALDSRKRTGSVLALPGSGTSYYPSWQFDTETRPPSVRPITLRIVTTFREAVEDLSLYVVAAWATSPQPELDDRTPADWIVAGGADEPVVLAAQRAAHLEAT
jgi:hypothetical protein